MDILFFVVYSRLNFLLGADRSGWRKIIFLILFIFISIANGIVFGSLIDSNKINLDTKFANSKDIIFLSIIALILVFDYVPSYAKRVNVILSCYPVSGLKRQIINVLVELLTISKLSVFVFLLSVFFSSKFLSFIDLIFCFLLILFAVSISRAIKGIIEYGVVKTYSLLLIAILGGTIFLIIVQSFIFRISLILILIFVTNVFDKGLGAQKKVYKSGEMSIYSTLFFPFYISNTKKALVFAFCAKAALLLLAFNSGNEISSAIQILVISPITIFTYVYNNTWGFFRNIWYQAQTRPNSIDFQIKMYFDLLIGPILIDIFLTFVLLAAFGQIDLFQIYAYLVNLANLSIIGFIVSMNYPVNVREGINPFFMKASTSVLGMIADFLLILLVWIPKLYPVFFLIVIVITSLLLICGYSFSKRRYSHKMHKIFEVV